ncbi:MAG: choice-of-anchor U domain-containing protein, partial [Planctomycetota bacterium]
GDFIGEPADLRNPGMVSPDADLIRFNERSADGSSGYVLDSINVIVDDDTNVPTFQISTSDAGLIQTLVQATLSRTKINSASLIDRRGRTSDLDQVWFLPNSTVTEISWVESNTGPSAEFTLAVDAPTSVTQEPIVFRSYLDEVDSGDGDFREIEYNLVSETVSGDGPAEYLDEDSYVEQIGRSLFISNVTDRERGANHHLEPAEVTFSLPAFGADAQHATVNLMFDDSFGLPEFVAAQFSGQQNDWLVTLGNNFNVGQSYQLIDAIVTTVDVVDSIDDGIDGGSFSVTIEAPRVNVRVQEPNSTGSPLEGRRIDVDYQRNRITNALNLEVLPNTNGDDEDEPADVAIFDQRARLNHGANSLNSVFLVDEAGISFRDLRGEEGISSLTASPWLLSTESLAILPALISEVLPGSSDLSLSLESLSPISQDLGTSRQVDLQQSQHVDLNWSIGGDVAVDIRFSATPQTIGWQQAIENEMNETSESASWQYNIVGQNTLDSSELPELDLSGYRTATATVEVDVRGFVDDDDDQISSAIENAAPGNGDGNGDGVQDASQINVASLPNPVTGAYVTLQAPLGQSLQNVSIDAQPDNVPPAELDFRVGVLDYEVSGVSVGGLTQLTIYVDGASGFNTFYKFGPTAARPTPHYYRFLFDGEVGAEFFDDRIVVHLKDGALGDDDLMANGIIVDPGAPTVNVSAAPHQNPLDRFDVTEDGDVTALDALRVINQLNRVGGAMDLTPPSPGEANEFVDVSGDNTVSALDALQVINELNRRSGLAEPEPLNLVIGSQQSLTTNASAQDVQGQSFEALEPVLNRVDKATVATDASDTRTTRAIDVNVPVEAEKFASDSERLDLHDRIIAEWEEVAPTLGNQNPVGH